MTFTEPCKIGILSLERGTPPRQSPEPVLANGLYDPASYDADVITQTVKGAWVENVVRGDPTMEQPYVDAARKLVANGANVITSACGFSIRHQRAVADAVDVPVIMSSLLILPTLLNQTKPGSKIAVLTYDSTHCSEELLGLNSRDDIDRIVVGGIEGSKFWHDELKRPAPPLDAAAIRADVGARVAELLQLNPEIRTILFECAGFPLAAASVRKKFGLPVHDITTVCRAFIASQRLA